MFSSLISVEHKDNIDVGFELSNGNSRANLANSSTRFLASASTHQNGLFQKCAGLAKLADIRQPVLLGLAKLEFAKILT
jgi:hypothetical protein